MMASVLPPEAAADPDGQLPLDTVYRYHDGTKHHFERFARSLGYLDWASQPRPFRAFPGTRVFSLSPAQGVAGAPASLPAVSLDAARDGTVAPAPLNAAVIGDLLRHALGLSAWKQFGASRWALRVNPSSGNLHPTEAYVVLPAVEGLSDRPAVYHYAAERHALELRCEFDEAAWAQATGPQRDVVLIALTSIHWREAWKYGERAFRYCQHDLGHAAAAVSIAAALHGWLTHLAPEWSHRELARLTGIDREEDFVEVEREEPECVLIVHAGSPVEQRHSPSPGLLAEAVARGQWSGHASQLSEDHVTWSFIDEVARATEDQGRLLTPVSRQHEPVRHLSVDRQIDARALLLRRRSAVAFDGRQTMDRALFLDLLERVMPSAAVPWNTPWWSPRVHLAIFVHRVEGLPPGLYLLPRAPEVTDRLRAACRTDFLWDAADDRVPLWRLRDGDARVAAERLSCDQGIAADGCFSLGMLADFEASLREFGPSFYRHLFWEAGIVGQMLYLEAEAAGLRGTGIGCFFDDPVHDLLGLEGHAFQSLYHFTIGRPLDDSRLSTEPGYAWEHAST